jgi:hypothetical protein
VREKSIDGLIQKTISTHMQKSSEDCADENALSAYLEGSLTPQETDAIEKHLADCSSCQEVLALAMKLQNPEDSALENPEPGTGKKVLFHFSVPISVLGGVFAAVILVAVLFRVFSGSHNSVEAPQSAELHPPAQKAELNSPLPRAEMRAPVPKPELHPSAPTAESHSTEQMASPSERADRAYPASPPLVSKDSIVSEKPHEGSFAHEEKREMASAVNEKALPQVASAIQKEDEAMPAPPPAAKGAVAGALHESEKLKTAEMSLPRPDRDQRSLRMAAPVDMANQGGSFGAAASRSTETKKIGNKEFYRDSGLWVDRQCSIHRGDPVNEITSADPEYEKILKQYKNLRSLVPVLIYWNNKVYLLR